MLTAPSTVAFPRYVATRDHRPRRGVVNRAVPLPCVTETIRIRALPWLLRTIRTRPVTGVVWVARTTILQRSWRPWRAFVTVWSTRLVSRRTTYLTGVDVLLAKDPALLGTKVAVTSCGPGGTKGRATRAVPWTSAADTDRPSTLNVTAPTGVP